MAKSGGGIQSKNVVQKPVVTGGAARGKNPAHVAQIGTALGNHATEAGNRKLNPVESMFTRSPTNAASGLGNAMAEAAKSGPGGSRSVSKPGQQGKH